MVESGNTDLMTPKEVAAFLHIHINTLYRVIADGKDGGLPYFRIGRKLVFSRVAVTDWFNNVRASAQERK